MFSLLQKKLGREGPTRLVIPEVLTEPGLHVEGTKLDIVEFAEGESKHIACVYLPFMKALLSADLVYNNAHLHLQERHLESWLARLDELEEFAKNRVSTICPGHGTAGDLRLICRLLQICAISPRRLRAATQKLPSSGSWPNTWNTV
jgi:glyoxylase-like metal-dependent hydrolase (beta-lactamase superfamily II)